MDAKDKKYLSVREAAEYIGYSVGYIYKLVAINAIPCYVPNGGRIIFNRVELDEWIKSKRQGKPENECLVIR
ncbi:MAG: helix-turn-helix domain-containing protein [Elusimicrobiaceae bacterium]|nr:helix-turn-helix domain-containing protein [Elusimicrobiaceae bacterium]MBR4682203.1 helix-turn-helix domain-containing protein [Elusimicrobiaceae bacterium]